MSLRKTSPTMTPDFPRAPAAIKSHRKKSTRAETRATTSAMLTCHQRKSRQAQLPPERERHTDAYEAVPQRGGQRRQFHPLVWLGVFGVFLVLGWFGLNAFTSWYQGVQDDWTYGKQRHFEINAVVGHNDSAQHPSHFTAENNNGQIIVIELPGGNVSKAKIYQIETVPGNAGNPPVKLMFQDVNGDGKPDMIVQIGDGGAMIYLTLYNNGRVCLQALGRGEGQCSATHLKNTHRSIIVRMDNQENQEQEPDTETQPRRDTGYLCADCPRAGRSRGCNLCC